jgi:CheY-like chemotaxis protein
MAKEILIADSDNADQEGFRRIFEKTDYHLVFSESGEDVLLRVKLFKPDLIIAGTALNEKNGLELCEAIKGDPEFKYIPFVLLLNIFEEVSEKDRKRLPFDGILSKPLREGKVLNMVDHLLEGMKAKGERISQREKEWGSLEDMKKEDFLLDEPGEGGEEGIIELLDVVEEQEPRMSIDDFALPGKEEPLGEITSLESWGKLEGEEKLATEEGFILSLRGEEEEKEEISLQLDREFVPKKAAPPKAAQEEEELFEKIELEDILEKVRQMQPSSEEMEPPLGREVGVFEEPLTLQEPEERPLGLEDFEALLQKGVETEPVKAEAIEEILEPLSFEELKVEAPEEVTPIEVSLEEKPEKLVEEEFPEELLEEELGEKMEEEKLEEEELGGLEAEELGGLEAEELEVVEEPQEEKIELFEELEIPKVSKEEIRGIEEPKPIWIEQPKDVEAPKIFGEEIRVPSRRLGQQMDEVISERVRAMMEEFITKHVPELTKDIIGLTIERIEKMVREIVPDLVKKMIEDEIKRLEKGETD